ncbi:hypothetical protein Hypma_016078 [Hypsizygus marmoreus]|uniref:Uncharacterized protein n=1 Tax=Hypsizygus marmoreus TaxID=39966 RepID=A0A369K747_HYPMA|nr:hypothetical protein Hypma_016078 [Hypsizygus marmoreus]
MHHESKVENPKIYEAEDQRISRSRAQQAALDKAKIDFDPHDHTKGLEERLAEAQKAAEGKHENENAKTIRDPLAPARAHGHEPGRGAQIDAQIIAEEKELLKQKGKA